MLGRYCIEYWELHLDELTDVLASSSQLFAIIESLANMYRGMPQCCCFLLLNLTRSSTFILIFRWLPQHAISEFAGLAWRVCWFTFRHYFQTRDTIDFCPKHFRDLSAVETDGGVEDLLMIYFRRNHSRHVLILNCNSEFSGFEKKKKAYHLKRKDEWLLKVVYWPFYPPCTVETIPRTSKMGQRRSVFARSCRLKCALFSSHSMKSPLLELSPPAWGTECFVRFQIHRGNSQEAGRRIAIENPRSARICCSGTRHLKYISKAENGQNSFSGCSLSVFSGAFSSPPTYLSRMLFLFRKGLGKWWIRI